MMKICRSIRSIVDASLDATLIVDADGNVLYKNLRAIQIFDSGEHVEDGSRSAVSSFFIFTNGEGSGSDDNPFPTWSEVIADMNHGDSWDESDDADEAVSEPDEYDANAFDIDGKSFPVTVSLAKLSGGCPCCSALNENKDDSSASETKPLIVAYIREQSDRQQHFVRYLEKEVRRLQSTQSAMDAAFDAFISINPGGTILSVNKATLKMFGYESKEMIGKNIAMIMGKEHGKRHREYVRRYMETGEKKMIGIRRELQAVHKEGFEFPVELGLIEVKSQYTDEIVFCAFVRDLSLQKGHEDNVKNKDMLTAGLIDASYDPMFLVASDGTIEMANKAASEIFGYSNWEFIGQNICIICNEQDAAKHDMYMQRYMKTGIAHVIGKKRVLMAKKRNGIIFPIELGIKEEKLSTGKTYFCGFVRDLTNEKLAEEKMMALIESSFDAMFLVNDRGIIELVNSAATKVFGYEREEFLGRNISIICNERDAKNHDKYMMRFLATGEKRVMGKERELAAKKKDGTIFSIQLGMTEVIMENGRHSFCGFVKDLTQKKLDEDRIQRKQQLMNGLISSAFDPMFLINESGIIQLANQAAVDHFGYSMEEFMGANISIICAGEHARNHDKYMQHYLRTGERRVIGRRRQVMAVTKEGRQLPIELGIKQVDTVWGEKMFCGFCRDVRREQFDEEELREREKMGDAIIEAMTECLLTIDENGKIYKVNQTACKFFSYSKQEFLDMNLSYVFGTEFAQSNTKDMVHFVKWASGRVRKVEVRKNCGTLHDMQLRIIEVRGAFPVLLGANQAHDGPTGTRMYAVFLKELKEGEAVNDNPLANVVGNIAGSLRNLGVEQGRQIEEDGDANKSLGSLVSGLADGWKQLTGGNKTEEDSDPEMARSDASAAPSTSS